MTRLEFLEQKLKEAEDEAARERITCAIEVEKDAMVIREVVDRVKSDQARTRLREVTTSLLDDVDMQLHEMDAANGPHVHVFFYPRDDWKKLE